MERPPVGHPLGRYLAHDAGLLAGVPGDRIGQWARWGHIRASVSAGDPHVYAFRDVAEALAVHVLVDGGFTLPIVRRAVERLGGAEAYPLSGGALYVVDHRLAVQRGELFEDVFTEHGMLRGLAALIAGSAGFTGLEADGRLDAAGLLRQGGWPALTLGLDGAVAVDPAVLGGRPHLRGRRVPVEDAAADDGGLDLAAGQADAARRWWACAEALARG